MAKSAKDSSLRRGRPQEITGAGPGSVRICREVKCVEEDSGVWRG